jgi:hypothetical protein
MGLGIALAAIALRASTWLAGADPAHPSTGAFRGAVLMIAGVALVGLVDAVQLKAHAGDAVRPKA